MKKQEKLKNKKIIKIMNLYKESLQNCEKKYNQLKNEKEYLELKYNAIPKFIRNIFKGEVKNEKKIKKLSEKNF